MDVVSLGINLIKSTQCFLRPVKILISTLQCGVGEHRVRAEDSRSACLLFFVGESVTLLAGVTTISQDKLDRLSLDDKTRWSRGWLEALGRRE